MNIRSLIQKSCTYAKANVLCGTLARCTHGYRVQAVQSYDELLETCSLLYRRYREAGCCEENSQELHFSPFMFAEDSRTFVIKDENEILGTISVYPDSPAGVPSESPYPDEIQKLRSQGISFVEVGLLALDSRNPKLAAYSLNSKEKMLPVFLLFKIMTNYVLARGWSHLLIMVHPRHAELYKFFGFKQIADVKPYHGAADKPALPMIFDLRDSVVTGARPQRRFFFRNVFTEEHFGNQLTENPEAFASLFGESYHTFMDKLLESETEPCPASPIAYNPVNGTFSVAP